MRVGIIIAVAALLAFAGTAAYGQPVTREEYDKLKAQLDQVQKELAEQKKQPAVSQAEMDKTLDEIEKDLKANHSAISDLGLGGTNFIVTGDVFMNYNDRNGRASTFRAKFAPIFLWQINDKLLAEAEVEIFPIREAGENGTDVALEYGDLMWSPTDWLTLGAGKFLLPFGYVNPYHAAWLNEFPDKPFMLDPDSGKSIEQDAGIGVFARGNVKVAGTNVGYAVYVINGPSLITDDPANVGKLEVDNNVDLNDAKTVGGRIAWQPIPELMVGYSIHGGEVQPAGFSQSVTEVSQDVEFSYVKQISQISGQFKARGEYVFSHIGRATYTGPTGPISFRNNRNGGYVMVGYRPTLVHNSVLSKCEFLARYETLDVPNGAPGSFDEKRTTLGVDYWITPSVVVKAAYEWDDTSGAQDQNALLFQAVFGF
jgi:hypothetical protein